MLSLYRLEKQFASGEYAKLLRGVLDNGLPLPLPLRLRLAQGPALAIALALRRVVEMTYGPTPLSRAMIDALLAHQTGSGAFTADDEPDPLATATAAAALALVLTDHAASAEPALVAAYERTLAALGDMQDADGLFRAAHDRTEAARAQTAAFVLWLLTADRGFRRHVRLPVLRQWFEARLPGLDPATVELYRLARVAQPVEQPATAAIAA